MKKIGSKLLIGGLSLTALAAFVDLLSGTWHAGYHYLWVLVANVLVTVVLFPFIWKNELRGGALVVATFVVYYLIGIFSLLIEAYIFNVTERAMTMSSMLWGIPMFFAASWILVKVIGSEGATGRTERKTRSIGSWIVKVCSGNVLYFVFYFTAGMILQMSYPALMDYYSGKIPSLATIAGTQLLLRGFLFVGVALIIDRYCTLGTWPKALLTGAIFAIIGGVSPLLPPSEVMPQHIRIAHGFEVGISNFLYGMLLHRILRRKPQVETVEVRAGSDVAQSKAVAV